MVAHTRSGCTWLHSVIHSSVICCMEANPTIATRLELTRQWLHAVRLRFNHPTTGDELEITSDYAPDLEHSLELLATR